MKIASRALILLFVVAALSAAGFLFLRREPIAAQSERIPALLSLAPAEAPYLFYADLAALRSSPFLTQLPALVPVAPTDRDYTDFVLATGFDYSRDLDRMVLAVRPGLPATLTVALAEGRFDREKISQYALRTGKVEQQNGTEVYVFPSRTRAKSVYFAFLSEHRVLLADGSGLASVLTPHTSAAFDPGMRDRIARVAGSALFGVGQVGPLPENFLPGGLRSDQFMNLVRSLRWFSFAARPEGNRLNVAVEGECDTPENARQLSTALDGLRLLGQAALVDPAARQRLQPQAVTVLETLLRLVEITQEDQRVRLKLELPPEILREPARR